VTLSYNVPGELIGNVFQNLRIYGTGSNLAYFNDYTGYSPENGGIDSGRFPLPVSYTLGVNLSF